MEATQKKTILLVEDDNITDIALNVGYGSLGHFWRVFKTINGMSPGEYRKRIKRGD
jgi:AraC-like DNA-binding protein